MDGPLSVGLPVYTHIKYVGGDRCPLQSIFRVPTLIELVRYDDTPINMSPFLPARRLLLSCRDYLLPTSFVAEIASLVELEVLSINIDSLDPIMALLTALGRHASGSAYATLDRNAVDDEHGEDAGTLN